MELKQKHPVVSSDGSKVWTSLIHNKIRELTSLNSESSSVNYVSHDRHPSES